MKDKFHPPIDLPGGIEERGGELDKIAEKKATARGRQTGEKFTGLEIHHEEAFESKTENEMGKKYFGHMNQEQLLHQYRTLEKLNTAEGKRLRRALIKKVAEKGYLADLLGMMTPEEIANIEPPEEPPEGLAQEKEGAIPEKENLGTEYHNHELLGNFLQQYLGKDPQAGRLLSEIQEIGKRVKHPEYAGFSKFDPETGKWIVFDQADPGQRKESLERALAEINKMSGREMFQQAPHLFMNLRHGYEYKVSDDGDIELVTDEKGKAKTALRAGGMGEFETKAFQSAFSAQTTDRISEHPQPRTARWAMAGEKVVIDKQGFLIGDKIDFGRIKKMWGMSKEGVVAFWRRSGGEKSEGGDVRFRCFHVDEEGKVVKGVEEKYVFILKPEKSMYKDKEEVTKPGIYIINSDQSLTNIENINT